MIAADPRVLDEELQQWEEEVDTANLELLTLAAEANDRKELESEPDSLSEQV